jgi:hypothetical protein
VDELTAILMEKENPDSQGGPEELTPLEAERKWQEESQRNVLRRLEQAGLLAPRGPVDEVAETVVRNLMAANGIALDVECRVLLTTPLETFSIGQSAQLTYCRTRPAMACRRAHAVLGHRMGDVCSGIGGRRDSTGCVGKTAGEVSAASAKRGEERLHADKLANADCFSALEPGAAAPQLIARTSTLASEEKWRG